MEAMKRLDGHLSVSCDPTFTAFTLSQHSKVSTVQSSQKTRPLYYCDAVLSGQVWAYR